MLKIRHALTASIALALSAAIATPAHAQLAGKQRRGSQQQDAQKPASEFPNATRKEPTEKPTQKGVKELQALSKLYDEENFSELLQKAAAFGNQTSNSYEKSFAFQMAAVAANELEDTAKSAEYFKAAVDANGLDNNGHYRLMNNLAVSQAQLKQFPESIATIDRFLAETRSDDPKYLIMKAGLLAQAGRNEEASALFQQQLAKNPQDKKLLMNAVATLQQADKFAEANALLEQARGRGLLTEAREYRALYSGLLNDEKWREAAAVIEDGVAKGVLPKDSELAKAWSVTANRAYFDEDLTAAVKYYELGAPLAEDGETWLNLAKIYNQQGNKAKTRDAARQALAKGGLRNTEEANRLANIK